MFAVVLQICLLSSHVCFLLCPPAFFLQCGFFPPFSEVIALLLLIVFIAVVTTLCKLQAPMYLVHWVSYQLH